VPTRPPAVGSIAASAPAPRVIHENERAPAGFRRFRCRAINAEAHNGFPVGLYILAADRTSAEAAYLTADAERIREAGFDLATKAKMVGTGEDKKALALDIRIDELPD
jgi:hypothetical protein